MATIREPFIPDNYFHVFNHSIEETSLFREERNYHHFLEKLDKFISPIGNTIAYCLMPNHYHFLVKIKTKIEIDVYFSKPDLLLNLSPKEMNKKIAHQFGNLQNAYAKAFNKAFSRRGSLFLHTVNRRLIVDKDYLKNTFHYIHNNPVRHKFVSKIEDWKFSSYHAYLENKLSEIQKKFGLKHFGSIDNLLNYHDGKFDPNFMIDMEYEY